MTSGVIHLDNKKPLRQTTIRAEAELLRKARYYLDQDGKSITEYLVEQLQRYVRQREKDQSKKTTEECA